MNYSHTIDLETLLQLVGGIDKPIILDIDSGALGVERFIHKFEDKSIVFRCTKKCSPNNNILLAPFTIHPRPYLAKHNADVMFIDMHSWETPTAKMAAAMALAAFSDVRCKFYLNTGMTVDKLRPQFEALGSTGVMDSIRKRSLKPLKNHDEYCKLSERIGAAFTTHHNLTDMEVFNLWLLGVPICAWSQKNFGLHGRLSLDTRDAIKMLGIDFKIDNELIADVARLKGLFAGQIRCVRDPEPFIQIFMKSWDLLLNWAHGSSDRIIHDMSMAMRFKANHEK